VAKLIQNAERLLDCVPPSVDVPRAPVRNAICQSEGRANTPAVLAIVAFVGKQFFVTTYTVRFARGSTEKMSKRTTVVLVCLVKYGAKRSALLICPEGKL
jgi:hypothetical protein